MGRLTRTELVSANGALVKTIEHKDVLQTRRAVIREDDEMFEATEPDVSIISGPLEAEQDLCLTLGGSHRH